MEFTVEAAGPCRKRVKVTVPSERVTEEFEKSYDQAFEEAFYIFMETTPFPAVCGRVCPHPCETGCNRKAKAVTCGYGWKSGPQTLTGSQRNLPGQPPARHVMLVMPVLKTATQSRGSGFPFR